MDRDKPTGQCAHVPRFDPSARLDCRTARAPPFRVLYVAAVGVSYSGLVSDAVAKLVSLPYVDVFLIHYDRGGVVTYRPRGGVLDIHDDLAGDGLYTYLPWYRKVRFATTFQDNGTDGEATSKPQHVRRELILSATMRETIVRDYSHVWVADENIAFPPARQLDAFLRTVNASGAAIAQPSMKGSLHPMLAPAHCAVRSTDFVEVMLPIMRTCVFEHVYTHLLVGQRTDWGLDKLWCRYFARFEPWKSRVNRKGGGTCQVITAGRFVKVWSHARKRNESSYSREAAHTEAACLGYFFGHVWSKCSSFCCGEKGLHCPFVGEDDSLSRLGPERICVEKRPGKEKAPIRGSGRGRGAARRAGRAKGRGSGRPARGLARRNAQQLVFRPPRAGPRDM